MSHRHSLTRTLAAALAIAAIAAPASSARPSGPASPQAQAAAAKAERVQDLRRLKAGSSIRTSRPAGTTSDSAQGPVYWSYEYAAPAPSSARAVDAGDGIPWALLAIGLAGAALLVGCATAIRVRAARRTRVAV